MALAPPDDTTHGSLTTHDSQRAVDGSRSRGSPDGSRSRATASRLWDAQARPPSLRTSTKSTPSPACARIRLAVSGASYVIG